MNNICFTEIWERIINYQGENFYQIRGKVFSYKVIGTQIVLNSTNQKIPKQHVERVLELVPLANTVPIQMFRAPSYLYAILMDKRIRIGCW